MGCLVEPRPCPLNTLNPTTVHSHPMTTYPASPRILSSCGVGRRSVAPSSAASPLRASMATASGPPNPEAASVAQP